MCVYVCECVCVCVCVCVSMCVCVCVLPNRRFPLKPTIGGSEGGEMRILSR
jgi:hypothetical protein